MIKTKAITLKTRLGCQNVKTAHFLYRLEDGISGSGTKARAYMSLYRNSNYSQAYPPGRVSLPVGSPLYVGVSVEERDRNFAVVLEDCFATHSSNPESLMRYPLIQNKYVYLLTLSRCFVGVSDVYDPDVLLYPP